MRVLPKRIQDRITFIRQRTDAWAEHAAALHITPQQAAEAAALAEQAQEALRAAETARNEARLATRVLEHAMDRLTRSASAIIQTARLAAESTGDPNLYSLAEIPAPDRPSDPGAPPAPRDVKHTCNTNGSITLAWKGTLAHRTIYLIHRQLLGERTRSMIGIAASRSFTDTTIPAGAAGAYYTIIPRRGDTDGPQGNTCLVYLGVPDSMRGILHAA